MARDEPVAVDGFLSDVSTLGDCLLACALAQAGQRHTIQ